MKNFLRKFILFTGLFAVSLLSSLSAHAQSCTQTFTPSNVGSSPFPGSNVNTAVQGGSGSTVLCFASGSYGEIDIFNAHPSGVVTLEPVNGTSATGIYFNLNGVSNVTITGFSGSSSSGGMLVQVSGQGNNSHIHFTHNAMTDNGVQVQNNTNANADILIDSNTFIGFTASNESARLNIVSDSGCPNGITVSNNVFSGGRSDGMNTSGASCGTIFSHNEISNIDEPNCNGIHCDGFQDNGGGVSTVLDGNWFHHVSNCWQITDGTTNLSMTNNVCDGGYDGNSHSGQMSPTGLTFNHNTIVSSANINVGNNSGGQSASNIVSTNNIFNGELAVNPGQSVTGTFTQNFNLCYSGGCTGANSLSGVPTYVGGSLPSTYAGYQLTVGSIGHNAASDGKDMGVIVVGSGGTPSVSFSPTSETFSNQSVGTTSAVQTVVLSNPGTATLSISSIAITGTNSGDFGQINTCGSSVLASGSCNINITFSPTTIGARSANVSVTDNATGSPQTVPLSGTGIAPVVTFTPSSFTFPNQVVLTSSSSHGIVLTNTGTGTLSITSISLAGANASDYSETTSCGGSLAPAASCIINVVFTPTVVGSRVASISVVDNASGSPHTVVLTSSGISGSVTVPHAPVIAGILPKGTVGTPYSSCLSTTGDQSPDVWSENPIIPGLAFSVGTGCLSGIPSIAGNYPLIVNLTDSYQCTVNDPLGCTNTAGPYSVSFLVNPAQVVTTQSLFTTQVPVLTGNSDGSNVNYELGAKIQSTVAGQITAIRFWKDSKETGTHTGHVWSSTGTLLATAVFTGETSSGWQQQSLVSPITITLNTTYVVSVNTGNTYYVATNNGFANQIVNGNLKSVVGGNGVYGAVGKLPTSTFQSSNYFRDIVFSTSTVPVVSISIAPTSSSISLGQIVQFSSAVTGSTNTGVTWSANAPNGLFTGSVVGSFTVTVTSVADPTKSASATVVVAPPAPNPTVSVSGDVITLIPTNISAGTPFTCSVTVSGKTVACSGNTQ